MAKCLAGGGLSRRRLNKLSCAGWLPHDRGFVSGLPRSKGRASASGRLITGDEGSPTGPAARQALRDKRCALLRSPSLASPGYPIAGRGWTIRAIAQMKPTISRAMAWSLTTLAVLPGAARRRYRCRAEVALSRRYRERLLAEPFDPVEQLMADPRLHSVSPGALDQHASGMGVAGLGDAAASDGLPLDCSHGIRPR